MNLSTIVQGQKVFALLTVAQNQIDELDYLFEMKHDLKRKYNLFDVSLGIPIADLYLNMNNILAKETYIDLSNNIEYSINNEYNIYIYSYYTDIDSIVYTANRVLSVVKVLLKELEFLINDLINLTKASKKNYKEQLIRRTLIYKDLLLKGTIFYKAFLTSFRASFSDIDDYILLSQIDTPRLIEYAINSVISEMINEEYPNLIKC